MGRLTDMDPYRGYLRRRVRFILVCLGVAFVIAYLWGFVASHWGLAEEVQREMFRIDLTPVAELDEVFKVLDGLFAKFPDGKVRRSPEYRRLIQLFRRLCEHFPRQAFLSLVFRAGRVKVDSDAVSFDRPFEHIDWDILLIDCRGFLPIEELAGEIRKVLWGCRIGWPEEERFYPIRFLPHAHDKIRVCRILSGHPSDRSMALLTIAVHDEDKDVAGYALKVLTEMAPADVKAKLGQLSDRDARLSYLRERFPEVLQAPPEEVPLPADIVLLQGIFGGGVIFFVIVAIIVFILRFRYTRRVWRLGLRIGLFLLLLKVTIIVMMDVSISETSTLMNLALLPLGLLGTILFIGCGSYCSFRIGSPRFSLIRKRGLSWKHLVTPLLFGGLFALYSFLLLIMIPVRYAEWFQERIPEGLGGVLLYVSHGAIAEEILFRFFIQHLLTLWCRRPALAIIFTSLLWTTGHAGVTEPNWVKMVQVFPIGVVLGWIVRRWGIEHSILAHLFLNVLATIVVWGFWSA